MKSIFIVFLLLIVTVCSGQSNYYKLVNDSIYSQADFDLKLKSAIRGLPSSYYLTPTIYHKRILNDSVVNYVMFLAKRKDQNNNQSNGEMVFSQDPLFLLLDKKLPGFNLLDLNNNEFRSSRLIGKPTLINFWSIQCAPCIEEFPHLEKLKEKYGDKVNFIAISENSKEEVLELLNRKPFNFYQLVDGEDYKKDMLKISSIPKNIFLDKNGIVREIKEGLPFETDEKTGKAIIKSEQLFENIINKLLKL
jgi:cytochrome c biogenesis protein CcmG, thiol:disulfide interchange protein DsbE